MRMKNAMQLKAHVNNIAKEAGIPYTMRRVFNNESWMKSRYRDILVKKEGYRCLRLQGFTG